MSFMVPILNIEKIYFQHYLALSYFLKYFPNLSLILLSTPGKQQSTACVGKVRGQMQHSQWLRTSDGKCSRADWCDTAFCVVLLLVSTSVVALFLNYCCLLIQSSPISK